MSDSQLEELKTVLNSLVIPYPEGLTLRRLCNEYYELEGQNIPFSEVGFSSVTALIKSMPNMIRMIGNLSDINSVILFPIKNENTKHIIDLVQKQNKGKKKSRRPSFPRFQTWGNHRPIASHRPFSKSANTYRNETDLQNVVLKALNTTLYNDLFWAYYKYFDALERCQSAPNSPNPQPLLYTNVSATNNSHISRPALQNGSPHCWRPMIPTTPLLPIPVANRVYTPKTVIDHSNASVNTTTNMTSLGERFLNFRITKTLNKMNEQPKTALTTRSATDLNSIHINGPKVESKVETTVSNSSNGQLIPNKLRDNIRVMMSSPDIADGFMLFNFEARYRHQFKESFNYKDYGYENLIDCLTSLSDVLEMIPTGTKTYKLMPLKDNTPKEKPKSGSTSVPISTTTVITNGHSLAIITSTATSTTVTFVTTRSTVSPSMVSTTPKKSFTIPATKTTESRVPQPIMSAIPSPPSIAVRSNGDRPLDTESVCSAASVDSINNRAKLNFRTILLHHENGINALDFAAEYEKYFRAKFDSRIWGYASAMELFHGLPQIFAIEQNSHNEQILHDSRFRKFEKPKPVIKTDINTKYLFKTIPDLLIARMLKLIQKSAPFGLPVAAFVSIYEVHYESLEATLHGLRIANSSHLFDVVKDELPIVIKQIDGQTQAFIKSKDELSEWIVRQTRSYKFKVPTTLVNTPPNIVPPGQHYRPIQLPERFKPGNYEYVAAYISSAVNPHEIYIQFKGADYHTALESLMFSLDFYDTAPVEQWTVPFEFLYVGYPVICRYPGDRNWHRARISRLHANDKRLVTVSFIDYGGTYVCDYKNLRLMKMEFLSLPVQALKVGLYGIKPILGNKASDWTASARDKLLRFSKPQYALACTLIETKPDNHLVAICDTNTKLDVFLHIVLVNDKHALMAEDTDQPVADSTPNSQTQAIRYSNGLIAQTNGF